MRVTIGVDVGTTVTKAVAFTPDGHAATVASRPTVLRRLPAGRYEQDPDQVAASVREVLAELAARCPYPVTGVGVTGQGDGLWLVDHDARAVRPAVSWLDGRAVGVLAEWSADGRTAEVFRRTGNHLFPGASGPLLAWMDAHEPAALARAATAGYCKDVVVQRLTGLRATEVSDASAPFLDPHTHRYDEALIDACGLGRHRDLLAPVLATPVGELTPTAVPDGPPAGTPVVAAPYDLPATAIGAGVTGVGDGVLIVGTTLACQVVTDRVRTDGAPAGLTLSLPTPGRWLRAMPAMVGSAALDWVLTLVGATVADLPALLAASPPGANGVRMLPFLAEAGERAPFSAPHARGSFDGLRLGADRADLVRATCEAIAYSARHCLTAAGLTGRLSACGGGIASAEWRQIFADVLGRPIHAHTGEQVGARGAARTVHAALGLPPLPGPPPTVVAPEPAAVADYEAGYADYLRRLERARTGWTGA
ncbi:FGGY-family carbohydrate kinase [Polymorphospora rubra]|uniref:FGGY-family carbohydrate kinase n=1 Tax=Polymorphospora rubra TaxID=338584 RepID=UPI0033F4FD84